MKINDNRRPVQTLVSARDLVYGNTYECVTPCAISERFKTGDLVIVGMYDGRAVSKYATNLGTGEISPLCCTSKFALVNAEVSIQ